MDENAVFKLFYAIVLCTILVILIVITSSTNITYYDQQLRANSYTTRILNDVGTPDGFLEKPINEKLLEQLFEVHKDSKLTFRVTVQSKDSQAVYYYNKEYFLQAFPFTKIHDAPYTHVQHVRWLQNDEEPIGVIIDYVFPDE